MDAVREDIVHGGKRPRQFPYAEDFLIRTGNQVQYIAHSAYTQEAYNLHQVIMSHGMRDLLGNPVAVETYEYSPRAILAGRTMEMYTEYMVSSRVFLYNAPPLLLTGVVPQIYCMEFKMLVVEQLSELEERRYLAACNYKPPARQNGYGVVYQVR